MLVSLTAWMAVNTAAYHSGGLRSPVFAVNAAVVFGTGVFVGPGVGIAMAAASALAGLWMAAADGWLSLPGPASVSLGGFFLLHGINLALVTLFVTFTAREVRSALARASHEAAERQRAEAASRDHEARLEALIEARDRTEAQLRQSQKMEALGQLAGGVAHDFNNLLTLIHGHLGILQAGAGPLATVDSLGAIEGAVNRAAALTRQLLAFSRRQVLNVRPTDLNELVTRLVRLLSRLLGETIRVELRTEPGLPSVVADGGLLDQVLMNLCVNARDAMPAGGRLTITTSRLAVGEADCAQHPDGRPGDFVCLAVADTGCGMSAATLGQIFQPFYTTKEAGKGTGLGLATVYGIVRQHSGWVEVDSVERKGTEFRVYLPASDAVPAEEPARPVPDAGRGRGRLLLVEDEDEVRALLASQLRESGYAVEEAANGPEALEWWRQGGDGIDLLVTDMVMPHGMTGRDLVKRLRAERGDLRVIFMSGYSMDLVHDGFAADPRTRFLQKPFTATELARAVRESIPTIN